MEPHPIPQNITSFEFHLVGDMTLKQFLYLGTGLGVAYLLYAAFYYSYPLVSLPLIIISVILGISFAFLPILDMPLDHWVKAFFNAVYSPTKGEWQTKFNKKQKLTPDDIFFKNRLQTYLASALSLPLNQELSKNQPDAPITLPTNKELGELVEMAKQTQILQTKIADTEKLIKQMSNQGTTADLPQASANLANLIQQTEQLYEKTSKMNQTVAPILPPLMPTKPQLIIPIKHTPNPKVSVVQEIPHQQTPTVLTSTPNVINGIVKDSAGDFLESVIVIIHNKEGIPVRALKTNKLGQFVGSTPLPSGIYTVTLEKEGYRFQTLEVTLDNSVLSPIEIIANKGGV